MLEGTDPVKCSMILTLMAEKSSELGFGYKTSWIEFGLDLLKLSLDPNNREYAMHPALDANLTPNWTALTVKTILGYEVPQEFMQYSGNQ